MATEVTQVLLNAQSPDPNLRGQAELALKEFEEKNPAAFFVSLCVELANPEKPDDSRRLAGLVLKNSLDGKELSRRKLLRQRWINLDPAAKQQIKPVLVTSLSAVSQDARRSAAQVIAKIAAIELPLGQWPELIPGLLNMASTAPAPHVKQSTLETVGYTCEEIAGESVLEQGQINNLLTAIAQGMKDEDSAVHLAATQAMTNALHFAETNFENETERTYIMRVVCESTLSPNVAIRQAAFECLVSIATLYYGKLAQYMQDIFVITSKAVKEDEESVALQAIEFWSAICDEETSIQDDEFSADSASSVTSYNFIRQALPALVPMLLETLTKQEEGQDIDDTAWNLAMAGGTCLGLVARTVGDDIVDLVMPFVQENVANPDWRRREAATYAFGAIMDGPSVEKLAPLVNGALSFLMNAIKDDNSHVRDTTAWAIARIFEFVHGSFHQPVITNENLPPVLSILIERIKDVPNVAEKICGAIFFLAQGYEVYDLGPSPLNPFFQGIAQALLETADRPDAGESRLRTSAYEALNEVIRTSSDETATLVGQLIPVTLDKLNGTLAAQVVSVDDREKQIEAQAVLCGVLQVIVQKLGGKDSFKAGLMAYADQMMTSFIQVLNCRSATVHEEAMLAIGALAYVAGPDFEKYMPELAKYLPTGLQNYDEYQVCVVTAGVVGDVCRALDEKMAPYVEGILNVILKNLHSSDLSKQVKPAMFTCIGDIALALGEKFEPYVHYFIPLMQQASEQTAQPIPESDLDSIDYNNTLRSSIFEAYTGIFQGFKAKSDVVLQYAEHLLLFIEHVAADDNK